MKKNNKIALDLKTIKIEEKKSLNKKNESSFVFGNLPSESAITLGNYYRRVILSYIKGVSIFAVRISNGKQQLTSEFSTLEGLIETPPYLIMNLKKLTFSLEDDFNENEILESEINIENNSSSDYIVKSSDIINKNEEVKILNSDIYLATISPYSSFKVDIYCKNSWGFKKHIPKINEDVNEGLILVDSNYNPILNVSFDIDFVATGIETQEEKLVLNIETNGSLTPRDALINALEFSLSINETFLDILEGNKNTK
ncbi:MAG TPA: hypothetical protein VN854_01055 [Mycoplasmatales bacterium]|jgi:DNA-directed RNA polymerase subunit alpha|nr:hypothetical protein [Mycoplasmatales bacterium]